MTAEESSSALSTRGAPRTSRGPSRLRKEIAGEHSRAEARPQSEPLPAYGLLAVVRRRPYQSPDSLHIGSFIRVKIAFEPPSLASDPAGRDRGIKVESKRPHTLFSLEKGKKTML